MWKRTTGKGCAVMQHLLGWILVDVGVLVACVQVAGSAAHVDLATHHIADGLAVTDASVAVLLHLWACRQGKAAVRAGCSKVQLYDHM
jgi:hypothetical protein